MPTELAADPLPDQRSARRFALHSRDGLVAEVSAFGARLMALRVPLADGSMRDVVVGHDRAGDHIGGDRYSGPICGRFAGRIAGSHFVLDGTQYRLPANAGAHLLHGGDGGFDQRLWEVERFDGGIRFVLISPAADCGFPGRLVATASYRFTDARTLECALSATTDAPTVVNLTNHVYWNLAGDDETDVASHQLTVDADHILELDGDLIPTGRLLPVAGTNRDFRRARALADCLEAPANGIDNAFVVAGQRGKLRSVGRLRHPRGRLALDISTTDTVLQVYTGNHFGPGVIGKGGRPFTRFCGIALEPQNFPDAPNHPSFPSSTLRPGEYYLNVMRWQIAAVS